MAPSRTCGHPNTPENTIYETGADGRRYSQGCRLCRNAWVREREARKRREAGIPKRIRAVVTDAGTKRCTSCGIEKPLEDFYLRPDRPDGYSRGRVAHCRTCSATAARKWQVDHPERIRARNVRIHAQIKIAVLSHYSATGIPECACCGANDLVFLALDHVRNNGGEHRRSLAKTGNVVYRQLRALGYPDPEDYQVLCHNCNWAKRFGPCPHKMAFTDLGRLLSEDGDATVPVR